MIRGICMLFVFFDHSVLYFPLDYRDMFFICDYLVSVISYWNMPCFFVVSGFLFANNNHSSIDTIKSKLLWLLLPYLCVCLATFCAKLIIPQFAAFNQETWTERLHYYLLDGGDRWFLYVLFIIFMIIAPLKNVITNSTFNGVIVMLLLFSLSETYEISEIRILRKIFAFAGFLAQPTNPVEGV